MHICQRIWHYFQQHRAASIVVGYVSVAIVIGLFILSNALGADLFGAFAHSPCSSGDRVYNVVSGDTLAGIATRYKTGMQRLASYNHIANPNLIYVDRTLCIPKLGGPPPSSPAKGPGNFYPYGQCTWYADQRYHQLHGVYVPWIKDANAWQWKDRAQDFHWQISGRPSIGAIINLQPWVEGAYGMGHVAVVEKILGNGHVIASSMNWGRYHRGVTYVQFAPGPGVAFITY